MMGLAKGPQNSSSVVIAISSKYGSVITRPSGTSFGRHAQKSVAWNIRTSDIHPRVSSNAVGGTPATAVSRVDSVIWENLHGPGDCVAPHGVNVFTEERIASKKADGMTRAGYCQSLTCRPIALRIGAGLQRSCNLVEVRWADPGTFVTMTFVRYGKKEIVKR